MTELSLSKIDAVKQQLKCAVHLYFNFGDEVSIHTLTAAVVDVLAALCEHRNIKYPLLLENFLQEQIRPEYYKEVRDKLREPQNFFKHADRDPEAVLNFNPGLTEFWLFSAVEVYSFLAREIVPEFRAYHIWFCVTHPNLFRNAPLQLLIGLAMFGDDYAVHERREFFRDVMAALAKQRSNSSGERMLH